MPVVDYGQYCEMLDRARKGKFAYPAINVMSLTTRCGWAVIASVQRSEHDRRHVSSVGAHVSTARRHLFRRRYL